MGRFTRGPVQGGLLWGTQFLFILATGGCARVYCTCDAMVSILRKINFTYLKITFILAYNYHCITSAECQAKDGGHTYTPE